MGLKKKLVIGALALTALGTIGGSEGYPPFYTKKVGTSVGINLGLMNDFQYGAKHYGINIGLINAVTEGSQVNGVNLGIWGGNEGVVIGVNANLLMNLQATKTLEPKDAGKVNGLEVSIFNLPHGDADYYFSPSAINGAQIGFVNSGRGNLFQVGIYNHNRSEDGKSDRRIPVINWRFD